MAKRANTGSIGGTALGLLALGFSSAVFGAMVIGPRLSGFLGEEATARPKRDVEASYTAPSRLEAEKDLEPRLREQRAAREVESRPVEGYTAAHPKKVDGNDELPCEDEEAVATAASAQADEEDGSTVYRVRVGRYNSREEAEKVRDELNRTGAASAVFLVGDSHRVQIGAYRSRVKAEAVAADLKARGYTTEIDERKRTAP